MAGVRVEPMSEGEPEEPTHVSRQLQGALEADDASKKDYHIRQALQLLEIEHLHE